MSIFRLFDVEIPIFVCVWFWDWGWDLDWGLALFCLRFVLSASRVVGGLSIELAFWVLWIYRYFLWCAECGKLSLIHISEPTRLIIQTRYTSYDCK